MIPRRFSALIDAIAAGRRPRRFHVEPDEAEVVRTAIELRAARPGDAGPTEAFVEGLFERLSEQANTPTAAELRPAPARRARQTLVAAAAAAVLVAGTIVATEKLDTSSHGAVRRSGAPRDRVAHRNLPDHRWAGDGTDRRIPRPSVLGVHERGRAQLRGPDQVHASGRRRLDRRVRHLHHAQWGRPVLQSIDRGEHQPPAGRQARQPRRISRGRGDLRRLSPHLSSLPHADSAAPVSGGGRSRAVQGRCRRAVLSERQRCGNSSATVRDGRSGALRPSRSHLPALLTAIPFPFSFPVLLSLAIAVGGRRGSGLRRSGHAGGGHEEVLYALAGDTSRAVFDERVEEVVVEGHLPAVVPRHRAEHAAGTLSGRSGGDQRRPQRRVSASRPAEAVGQLQVKGIEHPIVGELEADLRPAQRHPAIAATTLTARWILDSTWITAQRVPTLNRRIAKSCSVVLGRAPEATASEPPPAA